MYYVALFLNYYPLLEQKLNSFVDKNLLDVFFYHQGQNICCKSFKELLLSYNHHYSECWFVHGSTLSSISSNFYPQLPLFNGTSLEEIDRVMAWFANNFYWSIIPWGGAGKRFNSFVFISNECNLRDSFIKTATNTMDVVGIADIPQVNLFVTSYDVADKFSNSVNSVIFNEAFEHTGSRVWEACQCNNFEFPWIVTILFPEDEEDGDFPYGWDKANYQLIETLKFTTKEKHTSPGMYQRLGIYEPQDKISFVSMLQIRWTQPDTLIVVPKNTNLDKLKRLLEKTESHSFYSSYSDLSFFAELIELSNWFYGIDRDRGDYNYSLFVARDRTLIRRIDEFNQDNNYHLISCF